MQRLLRVFVGVLRGSRILLGLSYKLYGDTLVVQWRDAFPKQLRDEVKVQRPAWVLPVCGRV